ncbi:unnamed protein product [Hymenolepis diminuta]|uniref:Protein kinase domain-containing protein n=1 Tax=Hymenolepis diminuta TaxID=6216 RepID=A0A0R3SUQ4_HYMDI|nr:unnamed protein product [Hymenolepis diminuta]VUZ57819.1 unnamed protein product [Hymenolepis diminuta]
MTVEKFIVKRFFASDCYYLVFEVEGAEGSDKDNQYTLKRILLKDYSSIRCASRERRILECTKRAKPNCPHLPTLYYSFIRSGSPILVMNMCRKLTLFDGICKTPYLTTTDMVFYIAEIMCGLEELHSMQIVHLKLNENNILVSDSGPLVISDFDRSCYLSTISEFEDIDFVVRFSHAAPEIRS